MTGIIDGILWALKEEYFLTFLFIFMRMLGIVTFSPLLGSRAVPIKLKIAFSFLLGLVLFPTVFEAQRVFIGGNEHLFLSMIAREFFLGFVIGFFISLLFEGIQMGGQIIGIQMGFGLSNIYDPESQTQVSVMSRFQYVFAVLVFLSIDGHHHIIEVFVKSFEYLPLNKPNWAVFGSLGDVIELFKIIFEMAIKVSAPVIVTLLCVSATFGILARLVPQMSVFIIEFPVKSALGFLTLALALPVFTFSFKHFVFEIWNGLFSFISKGVV